MGLFVVPSPAELYRLLLQHDVGVGPIIHRVLILKPLYIVKDGITRVPVVGKWKDVNADNMLSCQTPVLLGGGVFLKMVFKQFLQFLHHEIWFKKRA